MPASEDPFCRVYVYSGQSLNELIELISSYFDVDAKGRMITTKYMDLIVDKNDLYDEPKSNAGEKRWLYFPYSLEIDPKSGSLDDGYVGEIIALLNQFWKKGLKAVAVSEFQEHLPTDPSRAEWSKSDS